MDGCVLADLVLSIDYHYFVLILLGGRWGEVSRVTLQVECVID